MMGFTKSHKATVLAVMYLCLTVGAATLFEDDFSSDDNWVHTPNSLERSLTNGTYVVENTGTGPGVLRNDQTFDDFTYSVTFTNLGEQLRASGLLFCWDGAAFEGYMLTLSSAKMFYLQRWVASGNGSATELDTLGWHSFINTTGNVLTVSKQGSTINLFCNGAFLMSVTDDTYSSGGIGLYVGPSDKIAFDHAKVTDAFREGVAQSRFCDDFTDSGLEGWRRFTGAGSVTVRDEALEVSGGDQGGGTILLTDGSYRDVPVKVVVTRSGGDPDGFAGIILMDIDVLVGDQTAQSYDSYVFSTTARGGSWSRYFAAHRLSSSERFSFTPQNSSHIHGTTDTLEVTATYDFVINGDTMPNIDFDSGLDFNTVGFIVDSGVVATFDDFQAGQSCPVPVAFERQIRLLPQRGPSYILGGTGILYDPRGRRVGRYPRARDGASPTRLAPGTYLVAPDSKRGRRLRKAIVEVR
jgi:hypothetical protein